MVHPEARLGKTPEKPNPAPKLPPLGKQHPARRAKGQPKGKAPLRAKPHARSNPRDRVKANRKVRVKVSHRVRERAANPPPGRAKGAVRASDHPVSQANLLARANPRGKGREGLKDKVNLTRERVKGVGPMPRPGPGIASRVDAGVRRLP